MADKRMAGTRIMTASVPRKPRTSDGITLTFIGRSLPFIDGKNAINDNSVAFLFKIARGPS